MPPGPLHFQSATTSLRLVPPPSPHWHFRNFHHPKEPLACWTKSRALDIGPITTPKIGPIETGNPNGMGMDMGNMGMDMGNMGMGMGAGTTGMGEHVGGYKTHGY